MYVEIQASIYFLLNDSVLICQFIHNNIGTNMEKSLAWYILNKNAFNQVSIIW